MRGRRGHNPWVTTLQGGGNPPPIPTPEQIHASVVRQLQDRQLQDRQLQDRQLHDRQLHDRELHDREPQDGELHVAVPQPVPYEVVLARAIFTTRPEPLSPNRMAVIAWFGIQAHIARQPEGMTARQLARRLGNEQATAYLARLLETLAERGEVRRINKGAIRYAAKPPTKVLPHVLRQLPERLPAGPRDAFDMAVLTYQDSPSEATWADMVKALVALIAAIPGWPADLPGAVAAAPAEWLLAIAGVEPPSYVVVVEDPVTTQLKAENARLLAEVERLTARVAELETFAAENEELEARLAELEAHLAAQTPQGDDAELAAFLDGTGRGVLPANLPASEVERLRALVLRTRAPRPVALAIAAGLGAIYRAPTEYQRLTTLSFKEHPFDSLWRARVASYRIVYGLIGRTPQVVTIASRADVYGETVHALKNRRF